MDLSHSTAAFAFLPVRLRIVPRQVLKLPALSKSNTLRGAFGMAFRRLVCIPQCREARLCPLGQTCPYKIIFEPSPPPGAERLSRNQDIPRPFIFRPPLDAADVPPDVGPSGARPGPNAIRPYKGTRMPSGARPGPNAIRPYKGARMPGGATQTTYAPGEAFDFTLSLMGKAVDYLPYFILAFREVAREGIGLNRAQCELEEVRCVSPMSSVRRLESLPPDTWHPAPDTSLVYTSADQLFRTPRAFTLADYVRARMEHLVPVPGNLSPVTSSLSTVNYQLSTAFLTPTYLKSEGQPVRQPEFHHLFKRVRDRLNALCTFYGPGPIDADFKGLGLAAEKVRTVKCDVYWQERSRRSSKTGQRHELSGFVGSCTYEFPHLESGISNLELLQWLICGELLHAGRHTAWGNGWYVVECN